MDKNPKWEEMTDFEKWFYGSTACADGDLEKDTNGEYVFPMTQCFHDCWVAAQENVHHDTN